MSGPLLLIGLPLALAPAVYALARWRWAALGLTLATSGLLSLVVLRLPLGEPIQLLRATFVVGRTMTVLGREFTFDLNQRPALLFLYDSATLLFAAASAYRTHRAFLPAGLAALGLLSAAMFVEPFLFAAIFIELAAALAVTMLSDPAHPSPRGALRFLVYMTMGMPFILVTGWLLEGSAVSPGDRSLATRATILLGVGFAILMAVIPFHTWIPELAEDAPPPAAAYVFCVLQGATIFLMLSFLNEFDWLRGTPMVYQWLRVAGLTMAAFGGVFGLVQQSFGRLMGYAVMVDIGATLLALGLGTSPGLGTALVIVAARAFGLGLWAAGMSVLRGVARGGGFAELKGAAWHWPLASAAVIVGGLSVAGFPLTAGFVGRWALYGGLAPDAIGAALGVLAAGAALAVAHARGLAGLLAADAPSAVRLNEGYAARIAIAVGLLLVLGLGLFPQLAFPGVARAALSFGNLAP